MSRPGPVPLPCSLDPLPDESLAGFLLRLSYRLQVSPMRLARLTGSVKHHADSVLGRRLLLDLDVGRFALATRLTEEETAGLTLRPWRSRYPAIDKVLSHSDPRGTRADWLFNDLPRHCPQCLAGDGSPVQQQYGGIWKKAWHLPIAFACTTHEVFLQNGCLQSHEFRRTMSQLIAQPADKSLHPAQCRFPTSADDPNAVSRKGRRGRSCGARLDLPDNTGAPRPSPSMLKTQRELIGLFDSDHPADEASSRFSDLQGATVVLRSVWPFSRDMIPNDAREAVAEHFNALEANPPQEYGKLPSSPIATAGLLTAASAVLDGRGVLDMLVQHTRWYATSPEAGLGGSNFR